jgi:hypothetical protein
LTWSKITSKLKILNFGTICPVKDSPSGVGLSGAGKGAGFIWIAVKSRVRPAKVLERKNPERTLLPVKWGASKTRFW